MGFYWLTGSVHELPNIPYRGRYVDKTFLKLTSKTKPSLHQLLLFLITPSTLYCTVAYDDGTVTCADGAIDNDDGTIARIDCIVTNDD